MQMIDQITWSRKEKIRGRRYDVLGDAIRYLVTMPDSDKLAGAAYAKARPRKRVAVVARSRGPHGVTMPSRDSTHGHPPPFALQLRLIQPSETWVQIVFAECYPTMAWMTPE